MNVYVLLKDDESSKLFDWNLSILQQVFTNKKIAIENLYEDIDLYKKIGWRVTCDEEIQNTRYIDIEKKTKNNVLKKKFRLIKIKTTKYGKDFPHKLLPY